MLVRALLPLLLAGADGFQCWELDLDKPISLSAQQVGTPACLNVPVLPDADAVQFDLKATGPAALDVRVQVVMGDDSYEFERTATQDMTIDLEPPLAPRSYYFFMDVEPATAIKLSATSARKPAVPPAPPFAPGDGPEPEPEPDDDCYENEEKALLVCAPDAAALCKGSVSAEEEYECLADNMREISRECFDSLEELSECRFAPRLLLPMEIASALLLATASIVLSCSLLRCCCRTLYIARFGNPAVEMHPESEIGSEIFSDEEVEEPADVEREAAALGATVAPLEARNAPGGAKPKRAAAAAAARGGDSTSVGDSSSVEGEEGEEGEELPCYTDVVEGARINHSRM